MHMDATCRAYTAHLRTLDPRLWMSVEPSARDSRQRTYWIRFHLADGKHLRLTTLDGAISALRTDSGLPAGTRVAPGPWIVEYLRAWGWERWVREARTAFSTNTHPHA